MLDLAEVVHEWATGKRPDVDDQWRLRWSPTTCNSQINIHLKYWHHHKVNLTCWLGAAQLFSNSCPARQCPRQHMEWRYKSQETHWKVPQKISWARCSICVLHSRSITTETDLQDMPVVPSSRPQKCCNFWGNSQVLYWLRRIFQADLQGRNTE